MISNLFRIASAAGLAVALGGCAGQTIYSTDPVDPRGRALPLERATGLLFEDGARLRLNQGETLTLADGRFSSVHGSWNASQVEALLWNDIQGRPERSLVLTPDDLLLEDDPPRITRIQLVDGEIIDVDALPDAEARFAENGLSLDIQSAEAERSVPIEQLHTVELHRPDILGATVANWRFWAVGGAAALVAILITGQTNQDEIAVR